MHDLDRTTLELEDLEAEAYEAGAEGEAGESAEWEAESAFEEEEEMELAAELLEVGSEGELDQFLGKLIRKAGRAAGRFIRSPTGRVLGGLLKTAARKALPIAGGTVGTFFGGPAGAAIGSQLASRAGSAFGLELEGLSPEDQEYEVARRFVRFAGAAAANAAQLEPSSPPEEAAQTAVAAAARTHAPGLLRPPARGSSVGPGRGGARGRSGKWFRRGSRIILVGI